ncbi:MAG: fatty acid desaturase family protein [Gammaproteobacteria bacterium]
MNELLSRTQIQELKTLKPWRTWAVLLSIWGTIGLACAAVAFHPEFWVIFLAVVLIGNRQFALSILMHEAAHRLLFNNPKNNDRIGQWLCSFPIMLDVRPYRSVHAQHHLHTETSQDPDLHLSRRWPTSRSSLTRKILRDLSGIAGIRRYYHTLIATLGPTNTSILQKCQHSWQKLKGFYLTNIALLLLFSFSIGWQWYFVLWWLPLLTSYSLIYRFRNVAEHALVPAQNDLDVARTTLAAPWYRWLLAPMNVNYHGEHHLLPSCPWYHLPKMHRFLAEQGATQHMCLSANYVQFFRQIVT